MAEEADELAQRRRDEIEFILSAFTREEAWIDGDGADCDLLPTVSGGSTTTIVRRLAKEGTTTTGAPLHNLENEDHCDRSTVVVVAFQIRVSMPLHYPADESLRIESVTVDEPYSSRSHNKRGWWIKAAYNALPGLTECCRVTAETCLGTESVLAVFAAAEEWVHDSNTWSASPEEVESCTTDHASRPVARERQRGRATTPSNGPTMPPLMLGRRLIYSHHIIAKTKRSDLKQLFHEHQLTGFVKVGWPGVILIEGREDDCQEFYDSIKRWSWQYLVVRGEMQEQISDVDTGRLLPAYSEVHYLSAVADHCRQVGLEPLFRTMMKVYEPTAPDDATPVTPSSEKWYGALIHVDHMNDGRAYRKWLRKSSQQHDVGLVVKECHSSASPRTTTTTTTGRPIIVVAIVGEEVSVRALLKKWRTSRVDVDARGKPCLERMMTVLLEQRLELRKTFDRIDWDSLGSSDRSECRCVTKDDLRNLVESIGGTDWVTALDAVFK